MLQLQKATEEVTRLQESLARGLITPRRVEQAERDKASFESQINAEGRADRQPERADSIGDSSAFARRKTTWPRRAASSSASAP